MQLKYEKPGIILLKGHENRGFKIPNLESYALHFCSSKPNNSVRFHIFNLLTYKLRLNIQI